jgi:hypothetical protein
LLGRLVLTGGQPNNQQLARAPRHHGLEPAGDGELVKCGERALQTLLLEIEKYRYTFSSFLGQRVRRPSASFIIFTIPSRSGAAEWHAAAFSHSSAIIT